MKRKKKWNEEKPIENQYMYMYKNAKRMTNTGYDERDI